MAGPRYWRSLDELAATPGFKAAVAREFPEGASGMDGVDRRQFMKIMAASFALGGAGLAGCRRPEENILPFGKSVEGAIPGLPGLFCDRDAAAQLGGPAPGGDPPGPPDEARGQPDLRPARRRQLAARPGVDPRPLRSRPRDRPHRRAEARSTAPAVKALLGRRSAKAHRATQGAAWRSLPRPPRRRRARGCSRNAAAPSSRRRSGPSTSRSPTSRR